MRKVVLDTNILVSALWSEQGNPFRIAEMIFTNEIVLYYTLEIIEEYEEVLCRAKFGFPKNRVESFLDELTKSGVLAESITSPVVFPDDPFVLTPLEFLQAFNKPE